MGLFWPTLFLNEPWSFLPRNQKQCNANWGRQARQVEQGRPAARQQGREAAGEASSKGGEPQERQAAREAGSKGGRQQGRQAAREAGSKGGRQQGRQAAREATRET